MILNLERFVASGETILILSVLNLKLVALHLLIHIIFQDGGRSVLIVPLVMFKLTHEGISIFIKRFEKMIVIIISAILMQ